MWAGEWYWESYKSLFEKEGYRCVTSMLRFHDMASNDVPDPQLGTTSLLDYAKDLENEIKQLGVKPIVIGHSMGALLAQILGSRGIAKALILLVPAAPAGIMALRPSVIRSFLSVQTKWGFWKKPMRQSFKEASYSIFNLLPSDKQKEIYDKFVYESGLAASEIGYWFLDSKRASRVDESKVKCPVLVIAGAKDKIAPASVVRKVAQKYKAVSTYKEFANHAHWIVAEPGWQEIVEYVLGWLEEQALSENA
ncbi:MAG: alpha/beta hydrolase [Candidatus Omnitrophota bacterium]|nr:MAG: alpha/beta hydrolase [Candidatus Omnitrophota bacterium]